MRSGIHLHTLRGTLHNYDYTRFYQTLCSLGGIRTLIICKTAYGPYNTDKNFKPFGRLQLLLPITPQGEIV